MAIDTCTHKHHGCHNSAGIWVCGNCWRELPFRPDVPILSILAEEGGPPAPATVLAPLARPINGVTMAQFIRMVALRLMHHTSFTSGIEAETYAADIIGFAGEPWGSPNCDWTADAAQEIVREDMQSWDCDEPEDAN